MISGSGNTVNTPKRRHRPIIIQNFELLPGKEVQLQRRSLPSANVHLSGPSLLRPTTLSPRQDPIAASKLGIVSDLLTPDVTTLAAHQLSYLAPRAQMGFFSDFREPQTNANGCKIMEKRSTGMEQNSIPEKNKHLTEVRHAPTTIGTVLYAEPTTGNQDLESSSISGQHVQVPFNNSTKFADSLNNDQAPKNGTVYINNSISRTNTVNQVLHDPTPVADNSRGVNVSLMNLLNKDTQINSVQVMAKNADEPIHEVQHTRFKLPVNGSQLETSAKECIERMPSVRPFSGVSEDPLGNDKTFRVKITRKKAKRVSFKLTEKEENLNENKTTVISHVECFQNQSVQENLQNGNTIEENSRSSINNFFIVPQLQDSADVITPKLSSPSSQFPRNTKTKTSLQSNNLLTSQLTNNLKNSQELVNNSLLKSSLKPQHLSRTMFVEMRNNELKHGKDLSLNNDALVLFSSKPSTHDLKSETNTRSSLSEENTSIPNSTSQVKTETTNSLKANADISSSMDPILEFIHRSKSELNAAYLMKIYSATGDKIHPITTKNSSNPQTSHPTTSNRNVDVVSRSNNNPNNSVKVNHRIGRPFSSGIGLRNDRIGLGSAALPQRPSLPSSRARSASPRSRALIRPESLVDPSRILLTKGDAVNLRTQLNKRLEALVSQSLRVNRPSSGLLPPSRNAVS